ncbi:TetR/AcrR family transcriptional regulator [Microbacterium awajiense]|uniref:TetR/AcrR family transcriptional regulator n=1 Tax=Microbacterium awajiense TaxID=415214 RepID=A0ABP7A422_9MICO
MPRASAADAARTAAAVLDAATRRFSDQGYQAVSIDEIAQEAGVTRGAVYHHFGDKAGVMRAVAGRAHERIAATVTRHAERHADPAAQLREGCHVFLDAITEGAVARLLLVEAPAALGWDTWRALDAAASAAELRAVLEILLGPGHFTDAATQLLSGGMNEAALWLADRPDDDSARIATHSVLDALISAVLAGQADHSSTEIVPGAGPGSDRVGEG